MKLLQAVALSLICAGTFDVIEVSAESPKETLNQIMNKWKERQQRTSAVYYELRAERMIPQGALSDLPAYIADRATPVPPEDVTLANRHQLWLDFENNRSRYDVQGESYEDRHVLQTREVRLCDGNNLQSFYPRAENTQPPLPDSVNPEWVVELYERSPERQFRQTFFPSQIAPIFESHGIFASDREAVVPLPTLVLPLNASFYHFDRTADIDGRELVVLKTRALRQGGTQYLECWVDLQQDAAVVRHVHMASPGEIWSETNIEHQLSPVGWIPVRWTQQASGSGGIVDSIEVVSYDFSPELSEVSFHIEPTPGMICWNEETDESFVASAAGETPIPFDYFRTQQEQKSRGWFWWIVCSAVLLGGYAVWRRRRTGVYR